MYLTTQAFRNFSLLAAAAILCALLVPNSVTQAQDADYEVDPSLYDALEWREVGPARGGRSAAVTGVPSLPNVYYMGASGGGARRCFRLRIWANFEEMDLLQNQ